MDADQLHKQQAATLSVNGTSPVAKTATATTATTKPVKVVDPMEDPEAPIPVNRQPQINPVRAPIASPFDILNR